MLHHAARRLSREQFATLVFIVIVALLVGIALLRPPKVAAQVLTSRRALVVLRGDDTLVYERIERSGGQFRAEIASPGQPVLNLTHNIVGDRIARTTFSVRAPGAAEDAAPVQTGSVEFTGDSAILEISAGGATRRIATATPPGTLPIINNDFITAEIALARARAAGVTSLTVPLYALSAATVIEGKLDLVGADSATFTLVGNVTHFTVNANGEMNGGALPAANLRIVALDGAAAARLRVRPPDYSAPAGAPYTAEEVKVATPAGHTLAGTFTKPTGGAARVPAIVTITGSGHQDRDEYVNIGGGYRLFREVADTLGRRGIAVLRLDDRGIGGSGGDVAGTTADFADDIRAAVAYLRTRADVDPNRIALVGHSEGGTIAPMVAATDAKLAGIVLLAGTGYTGRRIIEYQIDNGVRGSSIPAAQHDSVVAAQLAEFNATTAKGRWMSFFLDYDPVTTARLVKVPALILNGATDQQVRPEEARLLESAMRAGGNTRVTVHILPEQNHFFIHDPSGHPSGYANLTSAKVDRGTLGLVADWLVTTLGVR